MAVTLPVANHAQHAVVRVAEVLVLLSLVHGAWSICAGRGFLHRALDAHSHAPWPVVSVYVLTSSSHDSLQP